MPKLYVQSSNRKEDTAPRLLEAAIGLALEEIEARGAREAGRPVRIISHSLWVRWDQILMVSALVEEVPPVNTDALSTVFESPASKSRLLARDDQIAAELERHWGSIDPLLGQEAWSDDDVVLARYLITAMRARLLVLALLQREHEQRTGT